MKFFFLQGFQFENLKHANFRDCEFITKFDASCTPNLETLVLSSWKNLVEIDESFGLLKKLKDCPLDGCSKLQFLPSQLRLKSLYSIQLTGCARLEKFPEIHPEMECLKILNLTFSGIKLMPAPNSFWMIRSIHLLDCENLVEIDFLMKPDCFPESLSRFPRLLWLKVQNCKQLREIQGLPQSIKSVHATNCMLLDCQSLLSQVCFSFFLFLS